VAHVGLHAWVRSRFGWGWVTRARRGSRVQANGCSCTTGSRCWSCAMLMLAGGRRRVYRHRVLAGPGAAVRGGAVGLEHLPRFPGHRPRGALDDLWEAMATVRAKVRRRSSVTSTGSSVILDIDKTLLEIHSENKAGTAATYEAASGSTRCCAWSMPRVRRWPRRCGPATPGRDPGRSPLRVGRGSPLS
jgi:hypothetical protein